MKRPLIRPLVAAALLSLGAACSPPPAATGQGWVDAAQFSNIDDRGSTMVSNASKGWSR
jgi:hypothetical protein